MCSSNCRRARCYIYFFPKGEREKLLWCAGAPHHFIFHPPPAGLLIKKILCIIARAAPSLYTQGVIISAVSERAGGSRAAAAALSVFYLN